MKKQWKRICALAAAVVITISGHPVVSSAAPESKYPDGLYLINGRFTKSDSPDKLSMADAALVKDENGEKKPLHIKIEDGQAYVQLRFTNINYMGQTGYLGFFDYYPAATDKGSIPSMEEVPQAAVVNEYYEVFDSFNDPVSGSDNNVRGRKYPYQVTIPVEMDDDEVWTRVYVPVMEQIAQGSGTQITRLQLDWSEGSFVQVRDENIDIQPLEEKIAQALKVEKGEASEASWNELSEAISNAQKVLDNLSSTQKELNDQISILDHAMAKINDENKVQADKKELSDLIAQAKEKTTKTEIYTKDSIETLKSEIQKAQSVLENENAGQLEVNQAVENLKSGVKKLQNFVNKDGLSQKINEAENALKQGVIYTKESEAALKKAVDSAKIVLNDENAGQLLVDAQTESVDAALKGLSRPQQNISDTVPKTDEEPEDETPETNVQEETLDRYHLKDGVYVVRGKMIKTNKKDVSMSDKAVNHNIKLTVEDGKYYISMSFKGMTISGKVGYLGGLKYYTSGYQLGEYGKPEGSLADVVIDAYHLNEDGTHASDQYGTDYMKDVTFPLIPEALNDGYVPLQVFVPVMEDIAAGGGTQDVFLQLDYSTLKTVAADNNTAFEDNDPSEENDQSGTAPAENVQPGPTVKGGPTVKTGTAGPKTGDESGTAMYMILAGVSAAAILTAVRKRRAGCK